MAYEGKRSRVFHAVRTDFRTVDRSRARFLEGFRLVADVETTSLDEAFLLTNTMDNAWWANEKVYAYRAPCRSTSVGDVIVLPGGRAYLIMQFGYCNLGSTWITRAIA